MSFLRSRSAFFACLATALAVVRGCVWRGEFAPAWVHLWALLALGALLCVGVLLAKKRGQEPLLPAHTLWGLLAAAALCAYCCSMPALGYLWRSPQPVLLMASALCLLWVFFRRFSLIFWWVFLAVEMAQLAGYYEYGSRINSLVLAEVFEASGDEALAYLSPGNIKLCLLIALASSLLCWFALRVLRRQQRALPLLNTACCCGLLAVLFGSTLPPRELGEEDFWPFYESYVLGSACVEAISHNQATIELAESLPSPALAPSELKTLHGGEGVVLVVHIGESVRADHMSTNGYERDTTPWLRQQPRLINFPNCISAACDTCQAQIAILTNARRDINETDPAMVATVGSVLDLFQAHGFKVFSFFGKRDASLLKYDRVVQLLTRCASERFHAPGSPWTTVPQVAELLRREGNKQNTLIFINNEGSHVPFDHFDREHPPFLPVGVNFENPSAHADEVNNAYDATVHYTDEFVSRIARLLQGRPWVYLYVSDHGEYLGHDGIWGRAGLGESGRSYHSTTGCRVGMFVLSSPEFEQLHPHFSQALHTLAAHAAMPVAHEHIFHTLLGMFDLQTPYYSPLLDLASPQALPYEGPMPAEKQ